MGVNSFPDNIVIWLKSNLQTFYDIADNDSQSRPGWLKEIAETTMTKFNLPKEGDKRTADQYRKDISTWFRNKNNPGSRRKYHKLNTQSTHPSASVLPTKVGQIALPGPKNRPITLRKLYGQPEDNSSRINDVARSRQRHEADKTVPYVKHRNNILSEASEERNESSESGRGPCHEEFQAEKAKLIGRPNEDDIYANQANLIQELSASLQDLLGFEQVHQSGNMLLHVQGAYRGQEDRLETFSFVEYPPGLKPLDTNDEYESLPGYEELMKPWNDFASKILPDTSFPREKAIPENGSRSEPPELTYDIEGSPLLPRLPFERTSFAMILRRYIMESWSHHWNLRNSQIPFGWTSFTVNPAEYILRSCIPAGIMVDDPIKMESASLQSWYSHLLDVQERRIEFKESQLLFRGHNHLLSLQCHEKVGRVNPQETKEQTRLLQDKAATPIKRRPKPRPVIRSPSPSDSSSISIQPSTIGPNVPMPISNTPAIIIANHGADAPIEKNPSMDGGRKRKRSAEQEEAPAPVEPVGKKTKFKKKNSKEGLCVSIDISLRRNAPSSSMLNFRRSSGVPKPRTNPNGLSKSVVTTTAGSPAPTLTDDYNTD